MRWAVGRWQRATIWAVGALLTAVFLADAIDFFVFEKPSEINVAAELGWTSLFLLTVAMIEGALWLAFKGYNARNARP